MLVVQYVLLDDIETRFERNKVYNVKKGEVVYISVYGDTYKMKEALRKIGLKWNPNFKSWFTTAESYKEGMEKLKYITSKLNSMNIKFYVQELDLRRGDGNGKGRYI